MQINIVTIVSKHFNLLLQKQLQEHGEYTVAQATNYIEGLSFVREINPEIVIIDLELEAHHALSKIKEILISAPKSKIIAISDSYEYELKIQLLKLGIENFITKPFQPAYLWEEIDSIIDSIQTDFDTTDINIDSKSTYYNNLNSSIRNQIKSISNKQDVYNDDLIVDFDDIDLDTSNTQNEVNDYYSDREYSLNDFDIDFYENEKQLNDSNSSNSSDGYLGLPKYLDRESIYMESNNEIDFIEQEKTSRSIFKGVFKK